VRLALCGWGRAASPSGGGAVAIKRRGLRCVAEGRVAAAMERGSGWSDFRGGAAGRAVTLGGAAAIEGVACVVWLGACSEPFRGRRDGYKEGLRWSDFRGGAAGGVQRL